MKSNQKLWNQGQKALRQALLHPQDHQQGIELFLNQHAMVHAAAMSRSELWSFEDQVWQDLTEGAARRIPRNCDHSIAWITWHLARIEDVAINLLVAGSPQILHRDNWLERIRSIIHHAGNAMDPVAVADLSATVDLEALRAYRMAVGRRTREIIQQLRPEALKQKVEPSRLQQVLDEGALVEAARGIVEYWSRRDIAGLLLMPPTRHNFIHLNEAWRLKQRRR